MMKEVKQMLTLDQPAAYQIKVPDHLDESWADWAGGMTVTVESNRGDGLPGHHPDRYIRPGCLAGLAAPTLFPGLAVDFSYLCRVWLRRIIN